MSADHIIFAALSALLECAGFALVIAESNRLRREELRQIGPLRERWETLREIVRETIQNPAPQDLNIEVAEEVSTAEALRVEETPADPIERLRRRVECLAERLDRSLRENAELRTQLSTASAGFDAAFMHMQEQRETDIRHAVGRDTRSTFLFVLGVFFGLAAHLT